MRKALMTLSIFIIGIALIAGSAKAGQILYIDFDSFQVIENSQTISISANVTGVTKSYTYILSFTSEKYLSSMTFAGAGAYLYHNDTPAHITISVKVNGQQVASKTFYPDPVSDYPLPSKFNLNWTPVKGTDFTVDVSITVVGASTTVNSTFSSSKQYFYVSSEPYKIASLLTDLRYIPPGADNTPEGLILNQTEIYLNNTTLNQGTISFWLKWDGSTGIKITDSIGIDNNGYIYVKNADGTIYTLQGIQPPLGEYVPVYISWMENQGYIMMNTTKITLNWAGNVTISKIGNINQNTGTIIDELKVWDTYIPPDQIFYESQKGQYTLLYNNTIITIRPEGGLSLGNIDVVFLDENFTAINSTTLSPGQKTATMPAGTAILVMSRNGISRTYYLTKDMTSLTFPAEGATVTVTEVQVTPTPYDYLMIKAADGAIAERIKLNNGVGKITAIYGATYMFSFEKGSEVRTRVYTVSGGSIVFYISNIDNSLTNPPDIYVEYQDGLIKIYYYDANESTISINTTIVGYKHYMKSWEIHDSESKTFGLYTLTVNANDTDYAEVIMIIKDANGKIRTFNRVIYIENKLNNNAPFPTSLVPPALLFLGVSLVGIFVFKEPALMLLGGAGSIALLGIMGWIPQVPSLITVLTLLGILGLILDRR